MEQTRIRAFILVLAAMCLFASSESYGRDVKFLAAIEGDHDSGNRTPALTNGLTTTANGGIALKLGLEIPNNETGDLATQFYLGKKQSINTLFSNADAEFDRVVVEAIELYRFSEHFRAGGGLAYHTNADVSCKGNSCNSVPAIGIDNAVGGIVQAGYLGKTFELNVRYLFIDYRYNGQKFDGSGAGLVFGFRL